MLAHKKLRTELPSAPSARRDQVIAKCENRFVEWVDELDRGQSFDAGLSYPEVRPVKPGTHKEYVIQLDSSALLF